MSDFSFSDDFEEEFYSSEEFSSSTGSYTRRFIHYHPLKDAAIARSRRLALFTKASGLVEETRIPSFRHNEILEQIPCNIDHQSFWWHNKIPLYMTEPYSRPDNDPFPEICGLTYIVVPDNIAPYGEGGYILDFTGKIPLCAGYLFAKTVHNRFLNEVSHKLVAASKSAPAWNSVTERDRREAIKRVNAQKRLARFGGSNGF